MENTLTIIENKLAENTMPRCTCILILDTSSSMAGEPIAELNRGLRVFWDEVRNNEMARLSVEAGIVTFGLNDVCLIQNPSSLEKIEPPILYAGGYTPLGGALTEAVKVAEERKKSYKRHGATYYQPWYVLMTDGQPNDDWEEAARMVRNLDSQKRGMFFGVGIGDAVDMDTLAEILPETRPPKNLDELKFSEFFIWLSQSLENVANSTPGQSVPLPSTTGDVNLSGWEAV